MQVLPKFISWRLVEVVSGRNQGLEDAGNVLVATPPAPVLIWQDNDSLVLGHMHHAGGYGAGGARNQNQLKSAGRFGGLSSSAQSRQQQWAQPNRSNVGLLCQVCQQEGHSALAYPSLQQPFSAPQANFIHAGPRNIPGSRVVYRFRRRTSHPGGFLKLDSFRGRFPTWSTIDRWCFMFAHCHCRFIRSSNTVSTSSPE